MIIFVTYSNKTYEKTRKFCVLMAKLIGGVDKVVEYNPEDIDKDFYDKYKDILDNSIGNGYWLWKPYLIHKTLEHVNDGDIVLYCDAASFFFSDCKNIIASMDQDVWIAALPLIEKQFTKPELFETMNCTGTEFTDTNQIQGSFLAVRKSAYSVKFISEWLYLCCQNGNLSRETRYLENPPDYRFYCHRSDQSVLSLLSKKWGVKAHKDPSQYGRMPEKYYEPGRLFKYADVKDNYSPCIILHREKKPALKTCLNQWLCCWLPKVILKRTLIGYKLYEHDQCYKQ